MTLTATRHYRRTRGETAQPMLRKLQWHAVSTMDYIIVIAFRCFSNKLYALCANWFARKIHARFLNVYANAFFAMFYFSASRARETCKARGIDVFIICIFILKQPQFSFYQSQKFAQRRLKILSSPLFMFSNIYFFL